MSDDKWAEYREAEKRWLREKGFAQEREMTKDTQGKETIAEKILRLQRSRRRKRRDRGE